MTLETLVPTLKTMAQGADAKVVVNADSSAPNGAVVEAMLRCREAGVEHFLFAIKRE